MQQHSVRIQHRCAQTWPDTQTVPPPHSVEAGPPVQVPQPTKLAPPPLPTANTTSLPLLQAMEQMGTQAELVQATVAAQQ